MTIEEKIDKACKIALKKAPLLWQRMNSCVYWTWDNFSEQTGYYEAALAHKLYDPSRMLRCLLNSVGVYTIADYFIKQSSPEVCLTSPSAYIRNRKRWYMERGL